MVNQKKIRNWLNQARAIAPELCDWIGIYFKASYLGESSTDLILGPFIGTATEHVRIPLDKGICGLALREEATANIADVKAHPEYISCSILTKSELVIPLKDKAGNYVAELDIDCHKLNAFTPKIQSQFEKFCESFSEVL